MEEDLTGRVIGSYRVEARIGGGGMGEVYRAHDAKLEAVVALDEADVLVAANDERLWEPELLRIRGETMLARGRPAADAEVCFVRAIEIARL